MGESFILHDGQLFTPVRLGENAGFAHLDSGAKHSSVRESWAAAYPHVGLRELQGALGVMNVFRVQVAGFDFLGESFRNQVVDVLPDTSGGFTELPFPVLLALGSDVLLHRRLNLDFLRHEIAFVSQDSQPLPATERLALDFSLGIPVFEIHLAGLPLRAVFDTGAGMSVLNQRLAEGLREALLQTGPLEVEDPSGSRQRLRTYRSRELKIGKTRMRNLQFLMIDLSAVEQRNDIQIDFIFGISGMLGRRWLIDARQGSLEMG